MQLGERDGESLQAMYIHLNACAFDKIANRCNVMNERRPDIGVTMQHLVRRNLVAAIYIYGVIPEEDTIWCYVLSGKMSIKEQQPSSKHIVSNVVKCLIHLEISSKQMQNVVTIIGDDTDCCGMEAWTPAKSIVERLIFVNGVVNSLSWSPNTFPLHVCYVGSPPEFQQDVAICTRRFICPVDPIWMPPSKCLLPSHEVKQLPIKIASSDDDKWVSILDEDAVYCPFGKYCDFGMTCIYEHTDADKIVFSQNHGIGLPRRKIINCANGKDCEFAHNPSHCGYRHPDDIPYCIWCELKGHWSVECATFKLRMQRFHVSSRRFQSTRH